MIKVKNISKSFGKIKAVDNLSFELKKGDVTGLLGPNGAGKTTTMRMLTSYYIPTKGEILINGVDTENNITLTQQNIGYLPENNPIYLDMLVYDYLDVAAKLNGVEKSKIKSRILEVAKNVEIKDKLTDEISSLSKGYKQRVGIAAALVHNPEIIILDEPTEGLDPNQRQEIRKLIKDLSKEKIILISTHVMQEVQAMCNRVIVINEGRLVADGSPASLSKGATLKLKIEGEHADKEIKNLVGKNGHVKVAKSGKTKHIEIKSDKEFRPEINKLSRDKGYIIWQIEKQDSLESVFENLRK